MKALQYVKQISSHKWHKLMRVGQSFDREVSILSNLIIYMMKLLLNVFYTRFGIHNSLKMNYIKKWTVKTKNIMCFRNWFNIMGTTNFMKIHVLKCFKKEIYKWL